VRPGSAEFSLFDCGFIHINIAKTVVCWVIVDAFNRLNKENTMLYPKREQKLSPEDFRNPGSEYRAAPFWAWNNKLDKDELVWQIDQLKKLGYGGFHMHVRTGMATDYLSDEYMEIVRSCVEKARKEKMLAWLYDEDRWPSGAAGGLVTQNPKYRIRHLLLTRKPYGTPMELVPEKRSRASTGRCENGELVA
jgi:hypothetical protein